MRSRYLLCATVAFVCAGGESSACEDAPAGTSADVRLAAILDEWQRHSSARKSLEVRYERVDEELNWHTSDRFIGRVVLLRNGQALVEQTETFVTGKRRPHSARLIWADDTLHWIMPEEKLCATVSIAAKDRGRLPAILAIPFLWNMSAETLQSKYRVKLVAEQPETWLLRLTPLSKTGGASFSAASVWLDRTTYLPRRYFVYSPDRTSSQDFRVSEIRCDQAVPDAPVRVPSGVDWQVVHMDEPNTPAWLSRPLSSELVP
jgi:outer membrane lipoprotein-sorting protein